MRLIEFIQRIDEKRADRYAQMFEPLRVFGDNFYDGMVSVLTKFAMPVLKREDRIIWYMRYLKINALLGPIYRRVLTLEQNPETKQQGVELNRLLEQMLAKELHKFKRNGMNELDAKNTAASINTEQTRQSLKHFYSLGLPGIENLVLGYQSFQDVHNHFKKVEDEWRESLGDGAMELDEDAEMVLEFPDGWAWIDLKRGYCQDEGDAMGHCGNAGAAMGNTILSLRKKTEDPETGRTFWAPSLTFILNTQTGRLGEMKGRANEKPAARYHPYIIALLKLDIIKGIRGGGYMPQNNFSIDDLDEGVAAALLEEKPALAPFVYRVEHMFDEALAQELKDVTESPAYIGGPNKAFLVDTYGEISDLAEYAGFKDRNIDDMFDDMDTSHIGVDQVDDFIDDLFKAHPEWKEPLIRYLIDTYAETLAEQLELDLDDYDTAEEQQAAMLEYAADERTNRFIVQTLEEEDDSLYDEMRWAISDGERYGSESAFYSDFRGWMENPVSRYSEGNAWFIQLDKPRTVKRYIRGENRDVDHYYAMVADAATIAKLADGKLVSEHSGEEISTVGELEYAVDFSELAEPRYGWNDYDAEGAVESFGDREGSTYMEDIARRYGQGGVSDEAA